MRNGSTTRHKEQALEKVRVVNRLGIMKLTQTSGIKKEETVCGGLFTSSKNMAIVEQNNLTVTAFYRPNH